MHKWLSSINYEWYLIKCSPSSSCCYLSASTNSNFLADVEVHAKPLSKEKPHNPLFPHTKFPPDTKKDNKKATNNQDAAQTRGNNDRNGRIMASIFTSRGVKSINLLQSKQCSDWQIFPWRHRVKLRPRKKKGGDIGLSGSSRVWSKLTCCGLISLYKQLTQLELINSRRERSCKLEKSKKTLRYNVSKPVISNGHFVFYAYYSGGLITGY